MIRERTSAGLAAARAEGRIGGDGRNSCHKRQEIAESVVSGQNRVLRWHGSNVSQPTVSRIVAHHVATIGLNAQF
jgi:DNA invertase Pin-like site-specific DNA recombinase